MSGEAEHADVDEVEQEPSLLRHNLKIGALVALFAAAILIDHFKSFGDDWATFDGQCVRLVSVESVDTFCVQPADGGSIIRVHLLGIKSPPDETPATRQKLMQQWGSQTLTLKLDVPQTRDDQQRLLAYVFAGPGEPINVELVRDGDASVATVAGNAFNGELSRAGAEARQTHTRVARKSVAGQARSQLAADRVKSSANPKENN